MSDKMFPIPMRQLTRWIFEELDSHDSIFGLPQELFFKPWPADPFSSNHAGHYLETPLGVAAGPHTQLAQNIIGAYLMGARFIELKTVQPLDSIEVSKPCIDMQDLGYNCEWSQELRLHQSWDEYIKAWILVRLLRDELGLSSGPEDGFAFNMSVGYDLAGIKGEKVQGFLRVMADSSQYLEKRLEQAASVHPSVLDVSIPRRISSSVTLSTMHGCPPDEIERIGQYLIGDLGLDTAIKLNPTLLGPEQLREILNLELGFDDVEVPDAAFEHDPEFSDAVDIISSLSAAASRAGVNFWVKLTNTLETVNVRKVLPEDEQMHYMSGRALHPLAVQLAVNLQERFHGQLDISFSGGTDAFNLPMLMAGGLNPVTVCSDLLRPGGYGRLAQYMENISEQMSALGAGSSLDFAWRRSGLVAGDEALGRLARRLREFLGPRVQKKIWPDLLQALDTNRRESLTSSIHGLCKRLRLGPDKTISVIEQVRRMLSQKNLVAYAKAARADDRYKRPRQFADTKTSRDLTPFDCISAPCQDRCPTSQDVPDYMYLVANHRVEQAMDVVLRDNPLPSVTGAVCDHTCTGKCVRSNYDEPLDIRGIKGYIAQTAKRPRLEPQGSQGAKLAVVGAGPAGLSAAWFLSQARMRVVLMDERRAPGGIPSAIIPQFRLPAEVLEGDVDYLMSAGVEFLPGIELGRDKSLDELQREYDYVFLGLGALDGLDLGLADQDCPGVFDYLDFLERLRDGEQLQLGKSVLVIGGGNSAMDAARAAQRAVAPSGKVTLVYRRTQRQMPADDEELRGAIEDGVKIMELTQPVGIEQSSSRLSGLKCVRMALGVADSSGRPRPVPVEGSEFVLHADSLIVAVGQKSKSGLLTASGLQVDSKGRLVVDAGTGETNLEKVFAGGDVARGGSSIIQAVADAKRTAQHIIKMQGGIHIDHPALEKNISERDHLLRRMTRVFRPELAQPMSSAQAEQEASRCLACDEYCSICVTVCPNRANLTYRLDPVKKRLPSFVMTGGKLQQHSSTFFEITQGLQVLNMADMCNECGNCETFCPTAGAPYRDKPRLCFSRESFEGQDSAYFLSLKPGGWKMEFIDCGKVYVLKKSNAQLHYSSDRIDALLSEDFELESFQPGAKAIEGDVVELDTCASMFAIASALTRDYDFLPFA